MTYDAGTVFLYITGAFLLFVVCRLFIKPIRWVLKLMLSWGLGAFVIVMLNLIGSSVGLHLPFNLLNSLTVGVLGVPGIIMLLIFI